MDGLRTLRADNPGPFTLDGTRTRLIGRDDVVVIDPGPDMDDHVRAVVSLVESASRVTLAPTHGHPDHAGAIDPLVELLTGERFAPERDVVSSRPGDSSRPADPLRPALRVVGAGHPGARNPAEGERIPSDAGDLVVLHTPGHTRDHLVLHWPDGRTLFAGDLLLGEGDTTWVAEYPGCVSDYLASLDRVGALDLDRIVPAHGPDLTDPAAALERFRRHRTRRIETVRRALEEIGREYTPTDMAGFDRLYRRVYGESVPAGLERAARESLEVLVHHVMVDDPRG